MKERTYLACGFYLYAYPFSGYPTVTLARVRLRHENFAMDLTPDEAETFAKALLDAAAFARSKP